MLNNLRVFKKTVEVQRLNGRLDSSTMSSVIEFDEELGKLLLTWDNIGKQFFAFGPDRLTVDWTSGVMEKALYWLENEGAQNKSERGKKFITSFGESMTQFSKAADELFPIEE